MELVHGIKPLGTSAMHFEIFLLFYAMMSNNIGCDTAQCMDR